MLKWVLNDPRVASAVTEILNRDQMEEDLGAAGARLAELERETLVRYVRENGSDYCHGCAGCRRACPEGIDTPAILRALAYRESYGKAERAKAAFIAAGGREATRTCRQCGACEKACPYGVAVRARVGAAGRLLA